MRTRWNAWVWAAAATALLAAAAEPAPSDALRKQVLALNAITGEDAEFGKILELIDDPAHTKPLLAEAAKLGKEKNQPLNVVATRSPGSDRSFAPRHGRERRVLPAFH